jgi:alpha-tubulin suppressor-like RCC1 family protein
LTPVEVVGLSGVTDIDSGSHHSCAVVAGGEVRCWGDNYWRQLGDGTRQARVTPVVVGVSG